MLAPFRTVSEPIRELFYATHNILTRGMVWDAINSTGLADVINYSRRRDVWAKMAEYGFVVSPVGHGLDAHRTWEALALGCIVLTEASPLDAMYEENQLPVASFSSAEEWRAIDAPALEALLARLGPWR